MPHCTAVPFWLNTESVTTAAPDSTGFGFVEMASAEVAQAAITARHGMSVDGRSVVVSLARPREEGGGRY